MNYLQRFFDLLAEILLIRKREPESLEWLCDCFERIVRSSRRQPVDMPAQPPSSRRKGKRKVKSWELSVRQMGVILNLFKGKGSVALPLVEFFYANNNAPTARKVLVEKGFFPSLFTMNDYMNSRLNAPLADAGLNFGFRQSSPSVYDEGSFGDTEMQFCEFEPR